MTVWSEMILFLLTAKKMLPLTVLLFHSKYLLFLLINLNFAFSLKPVKIGKLEKDAYTKMK